MRSELRVLPQQFLERLRRIIPSQRFDAVANTFTEPPPTTFRVNTLKATAARIREELQHAGFHAEPVPWYRDAFVLRRGTLRDLQETQAYRRGALYVQSLSSMLPALILDPQPGEAVLDLTAAPGSKTTQMACLMRGEGRLVANDNNKVRFYRLKANVELQGARNVELSLRYGETFGKTHAGVFDRVLLDAPCSAEGRFQVREPASYRYWKPGKIKEMAGKQKRLLASALQAVKPGGIVVYSTCTFAPEENEGVLSWALGRFKDEVEVLETPSPVTNWMAGLLAWQGQVFPLSARRALRILPTKEMEGFVIARLRRRSVERAWDSSIEGSPRFQGGVTILL